MATIRQNTEIAVRIITKSKHAKTLTNLLLSLTVEEWVVYLPALLHDTHHPLDKRPNFAMNGGVRLPYADSESGFASFVAATLRPFGEIADESAKSRLSAAIEKLIKRNVNNKHFLNSLLHEMSFLMHEKGNVATFSFESMCFICESRQTSVQAKKSALVMIENGYCSGTPENDSVTELLRSYRKRFQDSDNLLWIVFRGFVRTENFIEAAETLPFLKRKQAKSPQSLATFLSTLSSGTAEIDMAFFRKTIVPKLSVPIRKRLLEEPALIGL